MRNAAIDVLTDLTTEFFKDDRLSVISWNCVLLKPVSVIYSSSERKKGLSKFSWLKLLVIIWRMLARSLHTSPREKQLCSFWVFAITPMASVLKKPESKWCLQHLLCWYTNTPVWINARVQAVCEMHAKGILLLPSRLQITQYLWLLGVDGILSGIDLGLTACPLLWNCSLGVLDTLPIPTSSSTLSFLYNLELHELQITSLSHTFLQIDFSTWCLNLIPGGIWRREF